jgi:hypothetical protein
MKTQWPVVLRFMPLVFAYFVSASWVSNHKQQSMSPHHRARSPSSSAVSLSLAGALTEPSGPAFAQQTPHSGRHFEPSHPSYSIHRRRGRRRGRFMEGWYYRLTIDHGKSFAVSNANLLHGKSLPFHKPQSNIFCPYILIPSLSFLLKMRVIQNLTCVWLAFKWSVQMTRI